MRILHTEASCGWGGQEIRILSEAQGLRQRGHEVMLVCPPEARIFHEAARFSVPVQALPIGRKNLRGLLAMRAFLARQPFDVINTHSSTDAWLVALANIWASKKIPVVRTRHISAPVSGNLTTRWLYAQATQYLATTGEALREQLLTALPIIPERIVSIPTGVDTNHYAPADEALRLQQRQRLSLPEQVTLIGIVATLRSWKGHRFLVDALAHLDAETHLVIVGDGPQHEALVAQIAASSARERIHLVGSHPDVAPWLQACDIFVLPSYANEGVPQALMQAMACGLPCITTAVGAIPELAQDGLTARVVPPQDSAALVEALRELQANPALRQRLGLAARARVEARYSREQMLDRMEQLFERAVQA